MESTTELFARWQQADGLATEAERLISAALSEGARGGPEPDPLRIEVARALRRTARERLKEAVAAYSERPR